MEIGYVVDGFGSPGHNSTEFEVAAAQAYTTDASKASDVAMAHDGSAISGPRSVEPIPPLAAADNWTNLPSSASPPLATSFTVKARLGGDANDFHLLALDSRGDGYDRVLICRNRDGSDVVAASNLGEWSSWAIEQFRIDGNDQQASVRFKLMKLAQEAQASSLPYPDYLYQRLTYGGRRTRRS